MAAGMSVSAYAASAASLQLARYQALPHAGCASLRNGSLVPGKATGSSRSDRTTPPDFSIEGLVSAQALGTEHKCGVTDTLISFWRPMASTAERYGLCERLFHARLPAPLPTHWGPGK